MTAEGWLLGLTENQAATESQPLALQTEKALALCWEQCTVLYIDFKNMIDCGGFYN